MSVEVEFSGIASGMMSGDVYTRRREEGYKYIYKEDEEREKIITRLRKKVAVTEKKTTGNFNRRHELLNFLDSRHNGNTQKFAEKVLLGND